MTELTRYVNTDSVAGGNGTTNTTDSSDANRAYVSLQEFDDQEATDLVTATDNFVVICSAPSGVADGRAQLTASWTTSATFNITIRGEGFTSEGKIDTNKYRMEHTATGNSQPTFDTIYDVVVEDMQCILDSDGNNNCAGFNSTTAPGIFRRCITEVTSPGTETNVWGFNVSAGGSDIFSCLAYKTGSAYGTGFRGRFDCLNNTSHGFANGYDGLSANLYRNCIASAAGTAGWIGNTSNGSNSHNVSNQNDAPGTDATNGTPTYTDEPNDDYRPTDGDSIAKDTGVDLSGTFDYDLLNVSFGANWDRGALIAAPAVGGGGGYTSALTLVGVG